MPADPSGTGADPAAAKALLRESLLVARRARTQDERVIARRANAAHLQAFLHQPSTVAGYLPLPTEPLDTQFLDELAATHRVLVPVVTGAAPLDWCEHPGPTRRGAFGIDEPTGPRLGERVVAEIDIMLLPALAVDRRGRRLGRGGGHYDRTLALRALLRGPARIGSLVAVLYDEEFLDAVPVDSFDQQVSAIVTPMRGLLPIS
ncbi:MAG: 5-formyltetrahydrofolate cyclo-ligase [Nakamurella sp.]